jgi:GT2 family glycosyltransferase
MSGRVVASIPTGPTFILAVQVTKVKQMIAIGILGIGSTEYRLAAWQSAQVASRNEEFEVFLGTDIELDSKIDRGELPFKLVSMSSGKVSFRAQPFIRKFELWKRILELSEFDYFVHIDADAIFVDAVSEVEIRGYLKGSLLAMVEQNEIIGEEEFGIQNLYQHYVNFSHRYILPNSNPVELTQFRFLNSGVVIFSREGLIRFLKWFNEVVVNLEGSFAMGKHMIADQDFLQIWANEIEPENSIALPSVFNHSPLWHRGFPDPKAKVIHLSNFCNGPKREAIQDLTRFASNTLSRRLDFSDLSIIVVTHNSEGVIGECIAWINDLAGSEVIVVDNASKDRTEQICKNARIFAHALPENVGFARASNYGASLASRKFLLFLNPDCYLTVNCALEALESLRDNPQQLLTPLLLADSGFLLSGVQPGYTKMKLVLEMVEDNHSILGAMIRKRFLNSRHDWSWNWALGTCLFTSKSAFEDLGKFNDNYFLYMEDVELGRSRGESNKIANLKSIVFHLGGASSKVSLTHRKRLLRDARILYAKTHYGDNFAMRLKVLNLVAKILRYPRVDL